MERMNAVLRLLVLLSLTTFANAAEPLRVMSFNVRNSNAQDRENAWPKRREIFFEAIARFGPDLIGFQEVLALQHDEISARLSDYAFSGVARDDGKRKGEWALIAYRRAKFAEVAHGDFWLSEHPEEIGSKSWDAALTRSAHRTSFAPVRCPMRKTKRGR